MSIQSPKCTVLKRKSVRVSGRRRLPSTVGGGIGPTAQAEIVGQADGCVIIKVTCVCGEEIQLRCAYADIAGATKQTG